MVSLVSRHSSLVNRRWSQDLTTGLQSLATALQIQACISALGDPDKAGFVVSRHCPPCRASGLLRQQSLVCCPARARTLRLRAVWCLGWDLLERRPRVLSSGPLALQPQSLSCVSPWPPDLVRA